MSTYELDDIRQAARETMTDSFDLYKNIGTTDETGLGDVVVGGVVANSDGRGGVTSVSDRTDTRGGAASFFQKTVVGIPCLYQARINAEALQLVGSRPTILSHAMVVCPYNTAVSTEDQIFLHTEVFEGMCSILNVQNNTNLAALHLVVEHVNPI